MQIGLVNADQTSFPNLALMKLSAHHKANGSDVELAAPGTTYDRLLVSKVFTYTDDGAEYECDGRIIKRGGSGISMTKSLRSDIEHLMPDYDLYGLNYSLGFLTRGCDRRTKTMKVVYIAGPFRADHAWGIECRVRCAEEAALQVAEIGAMPLCPHTNTRFFHGLLTDEFWLEGTMELLRRCDAVYLVPGWQHSSGTLAELQEAADLGLPVFESRERLRSWIEE